MNEHVFNFLFKSGYTLAKVVVDLYKQSCQENNAEVNEAFVDFINKNVFESIRGNLSSAMILSGTARHAVEKVYNGDYAVAMQSAFPFPVEDLADPNFLFAVFANIKHVFNDPDTDARAYLGEDIANDFEKWYTALMAELLG